MAPSIITSPVVEGKVPAVYTTQDAKDLPESLLSHFAPNVNAKHSKDRLKDTAIDQLEDRSVQFNPQYALEPRKLRIITIGAGFSGLLIAHKFQHRFPELQDFVDHTIFEGRNDIGGTWLVNTYPGVQCDVPSHIYVSLWPRCWLGYIAHPTRPSRLTLIRTGPASIQADLLSMTTSRERQRSGIWIAMCN